jgi:predicted RNA-binding Zn-ribbon protein involved in translation (DUF1610 family)
LERNGQKLKGVENMETTIAYQCPNCGAGLAFDASEQKFCCEFCLSEFTEDQISQTETEEVRQEREEARQAYNDSMNEYSCPNCGAQVVADEHTAADYCYFCHNPVVLVGKLSGQMRPDRVVPFQYDKEQAKQRFLKFASKKWFVPRNFFSASQVEKITGVYCEVTNITTGEVDDGFNLHLTFESGKRATVEVGTYNFLPLPRFYMQAKNGTAIIDDWQKKCRIAKLKAWCEKEVLPVQTAAGITKTMAPRDEITLDFYEIERPTSDVHDYYRNLVKAIDGKEEIFVKLTEVRRVLLVMEAAFVSAEKKEALKTNI